MTAPVLVVGAGPVGATTALLLAEQGVPSVVLEAAPRRDTVGSRAICFQRDVLDVFHRVGCGHSIVTEGVTWTTGRTYYRDHELFAVDFPAAVDDATPPWINISQARVEEHLLARAASDPLVDLCYGREVTDVTSDDTGVVAETSAGLVRGAHLAAADGAHSVVRHRLGIGFPGRSFEDRFLICDIRADLPFPSERRFFFDPEWNPGRQVLVHHCPEGIWRIDWQVPAGFDLDAERASGALDARIRRIVGDLPYEIVWTSVYRFHERVAERFRSGRVFLAGDAAHVYAPFGARGLNSGIQDAENLAWKLAFVHRHRAPERLLDSYHVERRAAALDNLVVTSATMDFLVPQTEEQRARRVAALERAVADPTARTSIDSGRLAEPYRYHESPLTTPAPSTSASGLGPGDLCPDARCLVDGRRTRLRRLFGGRFTALAGTARCAAAVEDAVPAMPVTTYTLDDIDVDGAVRAALGGPGDGVHLVRPDGHLAAVLPAFAEDALAAALLRAQGMMRWPP